MDFIKLVFYKFSVFNFIVDGAIISAQSLGIISSLKRAAGTLSGGRSDKDVYVNVTATGALPLCS